jgi:hypothetical protein
MVACANVPSTEGVFVTGITIEEGREKGLRYSSKLLLTDDSCRMFHFVFTARDAAVVSEVVISSVSKDIAVVC